MPLLNYSNSPSGPAVAERRKPWDPRPRDPVEWALKAVALTAAAVLHIIGGALGGRDG